MMISQGPIGSDVEMQNPPKLKQKGRKGQKDGIMGEYMLIRRSMLMWFILGFILLSGGGVLYVAQWAGQAQERYQSDLLAVFQQLHDCRLTSQKEIDNLRSSCPSQQQQQQQQLSPNSFNPDFNPPLKLNPPPPPPQRNRNLGLAIAQRPRARVQEDAPVSDGSDNPVGHPIGHVIQNGNDFEVGAGPKGAAATPLNLQGLPENGPVKNRIRPVFLVPTVPRGRLGSIDYLAQTLAAFALQPFGMAFEDYKVVVMNHLPGRHVVFEQLRAKYADSALFSFVDNTERIVDPFANVPDPDDWDNPNDEPGHAVRQQTCDLMALFGYASRRLGGYYNYMVLVEDDFPICAGASEAIHYVIRKANLYRPEWTAIRTSYGANGLIFPSARVPDLLAYLQAKLRTKPPDHLIPPWMCGHSLDLPRCTAARSNFVFRFNLFRHIGVQSSLRETGWANPPGCWSPYSDLQWAVDGFNEIECPGDDLWPCRGNGIRDSLTSSFGVLNLDEAGYHQHWISEVRLEDEVQIIFESRQPHVIFSYHSAAPPSSSPLAALFAACFLAIFW